MGGNSEWSSWSSQVGGDDNVEKGEGGGRGSFQPVLLKVRRPRQHRSTTRFIGFITGLLGPWID